MDNIEIVRTMAQRHINVAGIEPCPFGTLTSWEGKYISLDDAPAGQIEESDVEKVLYYGNTGDSWDGSSSCIMRLKSGVYVGFESCWGPTGDGFHADAYGGDTDIYFARDLTLLVNTALTDAGRERCGLPREGL